MEMVPFYDLRREIDPLMPQLRAALEEVLESGWYLRGAQVGRFERAFSERIGCAHTVACANGLDALRLAMSALGVGPGQEVIVPELTFAATALAAMHLGATVVSVDVDPHTGLLDAESVIDAVTSKTTVVVPVHLYGQMVPLAPIRAHLPPRVRILEDAAQAHGAISVEGEAAPRRPGQGTAGAAYSFYPGKNLGALGDAGAYTTEHSELAATARAFGEYGATAEHRHAMLGINSRMDELQAAVLSVRLPHAELQNARRRKIADRYRRGLENVDFVEPLEVARGNTSVFHQFVVRVHGGGREALAEALRARGIATAVHYPYTLSSCPGLQRGSRRGGPTPHAEALAREVLSLPIAPSMPDAEVDAVLDAIHQITRGRGTLAVAA